jgi:tetratricopeptide (TPR) repeat protein
MHKNTQSVIDRCEEEIIMETNALTKVFVETKQYSEAIKFLKKVLKDFDIDDFNRYEIYTKLGDLEEKIGQIKSSKISYKKAIKILKKTIKQMKKKK